MKRKAIVAMTSVGSLVGQVVLDALEGRRDDITLIGLNESASAPNNFRCDETILVPNTESPDFSSSVAKVCNEKMVDLLIPGRDPDIYTLSKLAESDSLGATIAISGCSSMALMMADKAETARFSQEHDLPFADTVATESIDAKDRVDSMIQEHGYPLIAKPASGSGSSGVYILRNDHDVNDAIKLPGFILQPYLDPPDQIAPLHQVGVPLFWQVREDRLHGVQVLIDSDGNIGPSCSFRSVMVCGRCEYLEQVEDSALTEVAIRYARIVAAEGWRGPFNVQAKRDHHGEWRVIELNGRFSGGTSARRLLGFDEVGWVINKFLGRSAIPEDTVKPSNRIVRLFLDTPLNESAIASLQDSGAWSS